VSGPGARLFQPSGVRYFDSRSQREMLWVREPGHELDGWICYQHRDGQWVTLRRANGRDLLNIKRANEDRKMENLPRTIPQIVARIRELGGSPELDMFGVERSRLLEALPFEDAKQFLRDGSPHEPEGWEAERLKTREGVVGQVRDYLKFAWGKANGCRGISAQKSMSHFKGLLWLLGPDHDELREWIGVPEHFAYYGKPALVRVSDFARFDWRDPEVGDDGDWRNTESGDPVTADEAQSRGALES